MSENGKEQLLLVEFEFEFMAAVIQYLIFHDTSDAFFYSEKYLQECWPIVKGALKEHGIACELNLVSHLICMLSHPCSVVLLTCYSVIVSIAETLICWVGSFCNKRQLVGKTSLISDL